MKRITSIFFFVCLLVANAQAVVVNPSQKIPIVYHECYNGSMGETLDWIGSLIHPFDKKKFEKIYAYLTKTLGLRSEQFYKPEKVNKKELLLVHDAQYLESLHSSLTLSKAIDLEEMLTIIPSGWLYKSIVVPQKYATGGTILAAQLAIEQGWAINIGGGYHHAKYNAGEGGCLLADIPLAIIKLRQALERKDFNVLIVDLDAHQGNGLADYARNDEHTFIFDMFNKNEYPKNHDNTEQYIDFPYPLDGGTLCSKIGSWDISSLDHFAFFEKCDGRRVSDEEYLHNLEVGLPEALESLKKNNKLPELIVFNAGTDPFYEDKWGCMNLSMQGMLARDKMVWDIAKKYNIPVVMVLSGGYSPQSAELVSQSIEQVLRDRKIIA